MLPHTSMQYVKYGYTKAWYRSRSDFLFRYFLALIIIPIPFEILFLMYDTCRENDSLSSIITPKNFVKVTRFKAISHNEMFTLFCFSRAL